MLDFKVGKGREYKIEQNNNMTLDLLTGPLTTGSKTNFRNSSKVGMSAQRPGYMEKQVGFRSCPLLSPRGRHSFFEGGGKVWGESNLIRFRVWGEKLSGYWVKNGLKEVCVASRSRKTYSET